jgi:hypothetical protein
MLIGIDRNVIFDKSIQYFSHIRLKSTTFTLI